MSPAVTGPNQHFTISFLNMDNQTSPDIWGNCQHAITDQEKRWLQSSRGNLRNRRKPKEKLQSSSESQRWRYWTIYILYPNKQTNKKKTRTGYYLKRIKKRKSFSAKQNWKIKHRESSQKMESKYQYNVREKDE